MKVLVTGGAGFIGANLCRRLVQRRQHEVVVLDNLSTGRRSNLAGLDVDLRVGTVLDADAVLAACRNADSIVHLTADPSVPRSLDNPRHSHDVNVTGTLTVLEAARLARTHVVIASSSSVYGRNTVLPKSEDLVCMPTSPHGVSKLAAESYAMAYQTSFGQQSVAFRFFNVFGPLQDPSHAYAAVIPAFILAALKGERLTIHGDGEQSRDFTYVDSVVGVLAEAVTRQVTSDHPVNLCFGTRICLNDLVAVLSDVLGRRLDVEYRRPRAGDIRHSQGSSVALRKFFPATSPVGLRPGLLRTIEWMESVSESLGIPTEVPV